MSPLWNPVQREAYRLATAARLRIHGSSFPPPEWPFSYTILRSGNGLQSNAARMPRDFCTKQQAGHGFSSRSG